MSLRPKLVLALSVAAVLPMAFVVGWPMLRAAQRAEEEAAWRLSRAEQQAAIMIGQHEHELLSRVEQAAITLVGDAAARRALLAGPEEAARSAVRELGERHGLDFVEILGHEGTVLSASRQETSSGGPSALADLPPRELRLRHLGPEGAADAMAYYVARFPVTLERDTLWLVGGRKVDSALIAQIAEMTGDAVELLDADGGIVASAGGPTPRDQRVAGEVGLGAGRLKVRVFVPAADVRSVRRELWVAFAGVAPLALISALGVGALLAHGITRPIRALADRAEQISAERSGPLRLLPERDEVRRLTLAFDEMLDALSSSERQRVAAERIAAWQEVARRIAHEVKNPLSPIKLAVENLRRTREKAPQDFDRALEEETSAILEEVESLRRLVDEFSLFARLPRPQPVRCDLRQLVTQALALYGPRIEAAGVTVEFPDDGAPELIAADPEQIGRVLKNVLSNALDAVEPVVERRLSVTVRRVPGARGEIAEIEVRDSGVGFEPEALQKVFEPYYTTRGDRGGSGLGMAIAHRIVTEHSGTIHVAGARGRGAIVTIRLPVEGPRAAS